MKREGYGALEATKHLASLGTLGERSRRAGEKGCGRVSDQFWLVWSPTGVMPPSHRHPTQESADKEAVRLARERRGHEFYVLEAVRKARVQDVQLTDLRSGDDVDDTPF